MLGIFPRRWITPVVLAIVGLLSGVVIYQLFGHNCIWWDCAPKRSFSELDLNLPESLFPSDAEVHPLHYLRSDTSIDPAISTNFWAGGTSIYRVQKSATQSQAIKEYDFNIKSEIFTRSLTDNDIKKYSAVLNYESRVADQSHVQCGYVVDDFRCVFVARYEEFTISFTSSIGNQGMTNDSFLQVISYIDNRMNLLLKRSANGS